VLLWGLCSDGVAHAFDVEPYQQLEAPRLSVCERARSEHIAQGFPTEQTPECGDCIAWTPPATGGK